MFGDVPAYGEAPVTVGTAMEDLAVIAVGAVTP